jgi:hypothetical protein
MREDEEFVLNSIARFYSGKWSPGNDPPDGYLILSDRMIAVEVSTLVQHVTDDKGTRSRHSDDTPAIRLANELDSELKGRITAYKQVMLVLRSPINDYRKTKTALAAEILSLVEDNPGPNRAERKITLRGNHIEIYLDQTEGTESKKIVAAVMNPSSNLDILKNVVHILEDRIRVKAQKCANLSFDGPIWLALLNDYFPTDPDTYRFGLQSISIEHPFEQILLVSGSGSVDVLTAPA